MMISSARMTSVTKCMVDDMEVAIEGLLIRHEKIRDSQQEGDKRVWKTR